MHELSLDRKLVPDHWSSQTSVHGPIADARLLIALADLQAKHVKPLQFGRAGSTKRRGPNGTMSAPTPPSGSGSESSSSFVSSALDFWHAASSQLAKLEFKLYNQVRPQLLPSLLSL